MKSPTHLSSGLVVRSNNKLHAVRLHLKPIEKLEHVQLSGVERKRLDLDDAVAVVMCVPSTTLS